MSSRPDNFMPLYIGDYLRDTTRLNAAQHGAYLLLIMDSWVNGAPPNDDRVLATITRCTVAEWRKLKPALAGYFSVEDGRWLQKRVERERARAISITESRRAAGRAGAATTNGRQTGRQNDRQNDEQNDRQTTVPLPLPLQPQSPNGDKTETAKAVSPSKLAQRSFEDFWVHCPRKVGKGAAKKAYIRALSRTAPETILAGIQRFAASCAGKDEQYIAHPATWLNGDRWSDEAPKPNGSAPQLPLTVDPKLAEIAARERANLEKMGIKCS